MPIITTAIVWIFHSLLVRKLVNKCIGHGKKHGKAYAKRIFYGRRKKTQNQTGRAYIDLKDIPNVSAEIASLSMLHVIVDGPRVNFLECKGTQTSPLPPFYSDHAEYNPPLRGGTYSSYFKEYQMNGHLGVITPIPLKEAEDEFYERKQNAKA